MRDALKALIDDAADTGKRIRGDVAHLRELGRRAATAATIATGRAKRKLEEVAEHIRKLEELRGTRGRAR